MTKLSLNPKNALENQGFTIVELMIASVVFSVILVLCTIGLIQISKTYTKGISTTKTEQVARSVIDQISQAVQFSGGTVTPTSAPTPAADQFFCVNSQRFSYRIGQKLVDGANHALVIDTPACNSSSGAVNMTVGSLSVGQKELLAPNMRLARLDVTNPNSNLWQITVRVVYGDDELLSDNLKADGSAGTDGVLDTCNGSVAGTQFCAVSELSTVVQKRIN